jgi:hypothetical protein
VYRRRALLRLTHDTGSVLGVAVLLPGLRELELVRVCACGRVILVTAYVMTRVCSRCARVMMTLQVLSISLRAVCVGATTQRRRDRCVCHMFVIARACK